MPKLWDHIIGLYSLMERDAEQAHEGMVWKGSTVSAIAELDLHQGQYSAVVGKLKAMDCVRLLQRGGGGRPSRWLLVQAPTVELFDSTPNKPASHRGAGGEAMQHIRALRERVDQLEHQLNWVIKQLTETSEDV